MPRISLDRVEKRYGSLQVLPPLDLSLNDGEFTVLVGPSGCGKSTTLRLLAGLETLTAGEIYFDDRPVSRLDPKDRDIAMVFQDYALYPHMNIAKNMSFALRLAHRPRAEIDAKVRAVAETLNIAHLLQRKPGELSGGQRQRVAMGRALVRDAATFLFDEPLSNLDAKLRAKLRTELAEMRKTINKNMVYVTHDQVEAMTLGDRIVVMNEGRVQQQGSPRELFESPANRFVAGFIGSPSMNLLDGETLAGGAGPEVCGDGFRLSVTAAEAAGIGPGAPVAVGIRPSAFRPIPGEATGDADALHAVAGVVEYLGETSVVTARCGRSAILVELPSAQAPKPGSVMRLGVEPSRVLLFDRTAGARLGTGAQPQTTTTTPGGNS